MQAVRLLFRATLAVLMGVAAAARDAKPVVLAQEHSIAEGQVSFRTPAGWVVEPLAGRSDAVQATHESLVVRFVFPSGGAGFDGLHVTCMNDGLRSAMEAAPQTRYEYDFLSGTAGKMRSLDSAFVILYDEPISGHREWRQRNLTLVGEGRSLCAIAYAPVAVLRKSKEARAALDAVIDSVRFP